MKQKFIKIIATVFSLLLCAWASPSFAEMQLNGLATHTNFGQDQFIAAVYCETLTNDAQALLTESGEKAMELRVVTDQLFPRRFKRMWIESMAINSSAAELEQQAQNLADFSNFLRVKLRVGDILRIEKSTAGVRVLVDGYEVGAIADPRFFDLLLRTWIGPVPLSTSFKNDLLVRGRVDEDLLRVFHATVPIPERAVAISDAFQNEQQEAAEQAEAQAAAQASAPAATPTPTPNSKPEQTGSDKSAKPVAPVADAATAAASAATAAAATAANAAENTVATVTPPAASKPKPKPKPKPAAGLIKEEDLFGEDSILDDEEDETLTAEALLNQQLYITKLTRWTSGFVEYPRRALRADQQGTVRLQVSINRQGEVQEIHIEEETQYKILNDAAFNAVKKASPYPAIPASIKGQLFSFTVPVVFRLE